MAARKKKAITSKAKKTAKTKAVKAVSKSRTVKSSALKSAKSVAKKKLVKKAVAKKAATKPRPAAAKVSPPKAPAPKAASAAPEIESAKPAVTKTASPKPTERLKPTESIKQPVKKNANVTSMVGDDLGFRNFTPYDMKKGEEYMNPQQVAHFRKILLDWKAELMSKVDETVHHMQDEAANFPDPNDRATQESDFTMELRTRDRERKLIKKIDESLTALDNEEYGYCVSCGIEVGIRRLEARPTATECIDCKTLNEIKEKQYGK